MTDTLAQYRHTTDIQVRWGDMDALGHVNNAVYLTYLEQARVRYIGDLGLWDARANAQGVIMARVVLDYLLPLLAEDQVRVYTRAVRLGNKSFDMAQLITRLDGDTPAIAAEATITVVHFDYTQNQTVPIPDSWRDSFITYEPALNT